MDTRIEDEELLTIEQFAERHRPHLTVSKVWRLIKADEIIHIKPGKAWKIPEGEFRRWKQREIARQQARLAQAHG